MTVCGLYAKVACICLDGHFDSVDRVALDREFCADVGHILEQDTIFEILFATMVAGYYLLYDLL